MLVKIFQDTEQDVLDWAEARNLIEGSNPHSQMLKLMEELGELAGGIAKSNEALIVDSFGDILVVLTILSAQLGYDLEKCFSLAYEEIRHRKGKMVEGVFVKEEDLGEHLHH